jgi:hypothetical protein
MTYFSALDGAASAVRTLVYNNRVALGNVVTIKDRDEDPAILVDNAADLPMVCVIPLGDKPDHITFSMGSSDWLHDFNLNIVGYYLFSKDNTDVFKDLSTVRGYACGTLELFRGPTKAGFYAGCNVKGADFDIGYFMIADYVIYRYDIMLKCTMYESA